MDRGRKVTPFPRAKLQGTDRKDRHGDEGSQIPVSSDKAPTLPKNGRQHVLGANGRKEWRRVLKLMKQSRLITEADRAPLTQYCLLWEQLLEDPKNFKASSHTQLRLLAESLGLSPPGRAKLRTGGD